MHPIIRKTFGGLASQYYFRQLCFGLMLAALAFFTMTYGGRQAAVGSLVFVIVSTLLYPYSRFVYEGIVEYFMGSNVFFVNAILMLFVKLVTMAVCWAFAIFIAPVGLAYLYYYHSKAGHP